MSNTLANIKTKHSESSNSLELLVKQNRAPISERNSISSYSIALLPIYRKSLLVNETATQENFK